MHTVLHPSRTVFKKMLQLFCDFLNCVPKKIKYTLSGTVEYIGID